MSAVTSPADVKSFGAGGVAGACANADDEARTNATNGSRARMEPPRGILNDSRLLVPVYPSHHLGWIPVAGDRLLSKCVFEGAALVFGQVNIDGGGIAFEIRSPLRPWNRHNVVALRQKPRECKLRRRARSGGGQLFKRRDQLEIAVEVLA